MMPAFEVGCQVRTAYGWGHVTQVRSDSSFCVELDEWQLAGTSTPKIYTTSGCILQRSFCDIGSCVLTKYGCGVLLKYERATGVHVIRLWNVRPQGSALAYMPISDIIKPIVAIPGMSITSVYGSGSVISYHAGDIDMYKVQLPYGVAAMNADSISCPESKIYPIIESFSSSTFKKFAKRVMRQVSSHSSVTPVFQNLSSLWQKFHDNEISIDDIFHQRSKELNSFLSTVDVDSLDAKMQSKVSEYVTSPEKIQQLLTQSKSRLLELIANAESRVEVQSSAKQALSEYLKAGKEQIEQVIENIKTESTANEKNALTSVLDSTSKLKESLSVMHNLSQSDPVIHNLLSEIKTTSALFKEQTKSTLAELQQTETGQILTQGSNQLKSRLQTLLHSTNIDLDALKDQVKTSFEKHQGITKSKAMIDGVKSLLVQRLTQLDTQQYVTTTIQEKLHSALEEWRNGNYSTTLNAHLNKVTILLTMLSESNFTTAKLLHSHTHISSTWQNQSINYAQQKLIQVLLTMKQTEENMLQSYHPDARISGFVFARHFTSPSIKQLSSITTSLMQHSAAKPITALFSQMQTGTFNVKDALATAKQSLNNEKMTSRAKSIIQQSDKLISKIEAWRDHAVVQDIVTKLQTLDIDSTIASTLQQFQPDQLLSQVDDNLGNFINKNKDKILEFLLTYLPAMKIPDIQGIKDDIQFAIIGLNLSQFKILKENISISVHKDVKQEFLTCRISNINAAFTNLKWKFQQLYFPYLSGNGTANAGVNNAHINIGFKLIRVPKDMVPLVAANHNSDNDLIYDTYPSIRSAVEAHRSVDVFKGRPVTTSEYLWDNVTEWEPALVMSSSDITMDNLSLKIDDSSLAWLYNLLASVFSSVIKEYVCVSLRDMLIGESCTLVSGVNSTAVNCWPMIHQYVKVDLTSLPAAAASDIASLLGPPKVTGAEITPREYTLKFEDEGPLGIQLDIFKLESTVSNVTVTKGCKVLVTGAVAGTQAEKIFTASNLLPFISGAKIISVNGREMASVTEEGVLTALRGKRPLYIKIRLSLSGWERLGIHRSMQNKALSAPSTPTAASTPLNKRRLRVIRILFNEGPLGLKLKETKSCGGAVIITGFSQGPNGEKYQAESTGLLESGMLMLTIAGKVVFGRPFDEVMNLLKTSPRPVNIVFVPSPDKQLRYKKPPTNLVLARIEGFIMLTAFSDNNHYDDGLKPGVVILQVNNTIIGADASPEDVMEMIRKPREDGKEGLKMAIRDMDAFMHLIRIRDGVESADEVVDIRDSDLK